MASHYTRQTQNIVREYRLAGGIWPASAREIAEWALRHDQWDLAGEGKLRACTRVIAKAMREEYITDESGRRVRAKHPAKLIRNGAQGVFWDDIRTASPDHMRVAVALRRNGIVAECRQLQNDVTYYNRRHPDAPLQLVLNFTRDVEELNQPRVA